MRVRVMPLVAALSWGCGAGESWSGPLEDAENSGDTATSAGLPQSDDGDRELVIGQARQAVINLESCLAAVPPFIFPQDVFALEIGSTFRPVSLCGSPSSHIFRITNFVSALGVPTARPIGASPEECADLEVFVAAGRDVGVGERAELVLFGSERGEVRVRSDGTPFCFLEVPMLSFSMTDGEDYNYIAQVIRDGSDGNTEGVEIVER